MNHHSHSATAAMRQGWSRLLMLLLVLFGSGYAHAYPFLYAGVDYHTWDFADDIPSYTRHTFLTTTDVSSDKVVSYISLPEGRTTIRLSPDGRLGALISDSLYIFDTAGPTGLANPFDTGIDHTADIVFTPDGREAYVLRQVSGQPPTLLIFKVTPWKKVGEIVDARLTELPYDFESPLIMSPNGKRAYLAGTGGMSVIDTHARKVVASMPEVTGEFLINVDGTKAVMFDLFSQPYVVDLITLATPWVLPVSVYLPRDVIMAPDLDRLYVIDGAYGRIVAVDLRTLTSTIFADSPYESMGASTGTLYVSPDGSRLLATTYTGDYEGGMETTLFPSVDLRNGAVSLIGPPGGFFRPIFPFETAAAFTPDSRRAYFSADWKLQSVDMNTRVIKEVAQIATGVDVNDMIDSLHMAVSPLSLRCSGDWKVDGADRVCTGGLFKNKFWGYVWPPEHIRKVDFYLDGKFRRSEGYPPFELDGGAATGLSNGPHELRAVLQFKDGSKPMTLTSTFDVGQPPLRCSADAVVDGNDQACDAGTFNKPLWIYWWPQYGIKSIDFYLDGEFHRTERSAPWEFDGGAATNLAEGSHEIRSIVKFNDGRQPLTVNTTVIRE